MTKFQRSYLNLYHYCRQLIEAPFLRKEGFWTQPPTPDTFGTSLEHLQKTGVVKIYSIQQDWVKRINFKFQQVKLAMQWTPQKPSSSQIQSPFVDCVTECRSSMRKLRKKIYKHLKYNPEYQRPQAANLPQSLKRATLPEHLLDRIRMGGQLHLSALPSPDLQNVLPISEIKKCADRQENQARIILQEWKNSSNIEKHSQLSKSSAKRATAARWPASAQLENELSQHASSSSLLGLEQKTPFVNCFEQLSHQKISSGLRENSLMEICSNIFDQSNLYEFK